MKPSAVHSEVVEYCITTCTFSPRRNGVGKVMVRVEPRTGTDAARVNFKGVPGGGVVVDEDEVHKLQLVMFKTAVSNLTTTTLSANAVRE